MSEFKQITMSIEDLARSLGLSVSTVRRMWYAGDLPPPRRFGRRNVKWLRTDLETWVKAVKPLAPEGLPANRLPTEERSYP